MKILQAEQDQLAISILKNCIAEHANFRFMFGPHPAKWRTRLFFRTSVKHARHQNGAYISNNEQGVAFIWCNKNPEKRSPISFLQSLFIFPLRKLFKITRFQKQVKRLLPKEPHLYFQFLALGESSNSIATLLDLRDNTFSLADSMHMPIYAQTANEKTKKIYERYGFNTYEELKFPKMDSKLYFLKRECRVTA